MTTRRRTFKIFHLDRILGEIDYGSYKGPESTYDQHTAMIVIAETVQAARELAADNASDEGAHVWLDRRKSSIADLGVANADNAKESVILVDHNES